MSERPVAPTPEINRKQAQAADPRTSVWVSANAGAGKTHVLTQRVLRLLLTGVAPAEILCLTYTKAAAAEMRARVTKRLGDWALMAEDGLVEELDKLTGAVPDADLLHRARTLFAQALDTPGGLKINTIHAFCESVLHRFPLEAGVPFGFMVIEDAERERLVRQAREQVFAEALDGRGAVAGAVETLFDFMSDTAMEKAVASALSEMRKLVPVLIDPDAAKARLRRFLNVGQFADLTALRNDFAARTLITRDDVLLIRNALEPKPGGGRAIDGLAAIADPSAPTADELTAIFFTRDGAPRKSLLNKASAETYPALLEMLEREQARLVELMAEITRAELIMRSEALIDVLAAIVAAYERLKRARARLDFDDLVTRTAALFGNPAQGAWVRYKLDAGITHILVDESQDTNPEQWRVVDALAEEFFVGKSAAERPRSLFAVGDPKQSIFSFQGAEPALFADSGHAYEKKAREAQHRFSHIPMAASFRTLQAVLDAVDKVFVPGPLRDAVVVGETYSDHISARTHKGGRVVLWPLVVAEKSEPEADAWTPPASSQTLRTPAQQLADRIAGTIAEWIDKGRVLGGRSRAIRADDILILVQSRNAFFHELIRALKKKGLPTPGADRLDVGTHIATRDLLALGDVLLNPADDLTLAALLRSPLFDVGEDDLFALAQGRDGSLFDAMRASAVPSVADAFMRLKAWRDRLDFERPYEFYAEVLYAGGGLCRFHARLGGEVDDVVSEFLDLALQYEQSALPSLQGFVAEMRSRQVEIKRDLGDSGTGIRVMTIHGAKGLEAPIVVLADAAQKPQGSQIHRALYFAKGREGPFLFHASGRTQHTKETLVHYEAERAAQLAEYWRKLYVGMTRAEDELHIAGTLTANGKPDGTWYEVVAAALMSETAPAEIAAGFSAGIFPKDAGADVFLAPKEAAASASQGVEIAPLTLPRKPVLLTPSTAGSETDPLDAPIETVGDADAARRAGIAVHALLQHLPGVPAAQRKDVARAALVTVLPGDPARHDDLAETACALVADPALAGVFGADSRAEVPIQARARRNGKDALIAGRIDRLIVAPEGVTIVDFKSDAHPATDAGSIPPAYVAQLGLYRAVLQRIYPDKAISAALLWTASGKLMPVPEDAMLEATAEVVIC